MEIALWIIAVSEVVCAIAATVMAVTSRRHLRVSVDNSAVNKANSLENLRLRNEELLVVKERDAYQRRLWGDVDENGTPVSVTLEPAEGGE